MPSIFSSHTKSACRPRARSTRFPQAFSSSQENALSSESIGVRWRTGANSSLGAPPTRWVGLSGTMSSGKASSSPRSSRISSSYSASEISGSSWTWYRQLWWSMRSRSSSTRRFASDRRRSSVRAIGGDDTGGPDALVGQRAFAGPEAARNNLEHPERDPRLAIQYSMELPGGNAEEGRGSFGDHACRPGLAVEERHLAEEVAPAEAADGPPLPHHPGLPFQDDEEHRSAGALLHHRGVLAVPHDAAHPGDGPPVTAAQPGEQRRPGQGPLPPGHTAPGHAPATPLGGPVDPLHPGAGPGLSHRIRPRPGPPAGSGPRRPPEPASPAGPRAFAGAPRGPRHRC